MNQNKSGSKLAFYIAITCTVLGIGLFLALYVDALLSLAPTDVGGDPLTGSGLSIAIDTLGGAA